MQPKSGHAGNLFAGKLVGRLAAFGLSLVLAVPVIVLLQGGCSSKPPPSQRTVQPSGVLKVACPSETAATVVRNCSRGWAATAGVRVETLRYNPETVAETGPPADVWILPPAQMPRWAAAGQLHPVPEKYLARRGDYAWDNILPLYRYKLLVWDEKVYALPFLGDPWLCFYREDLFRDPHHRDAFKKKYGRDLAAPATWEEFADIAAYFHQQKRPAIDHPCPSLPPLPIRDDDLDREFYAVATSFARRAVREDDPKPGPNVEIFSFHYDLETGEVRIDKPGFVHALQFLQRLQKYRPASPSPEPPLSFQRGEAVLCLASPAWIQRFQENPNLRGKFGLCQVPGSTRVFAYRSGEGQPVPGGNRVPYLGAGGWITVVPHGTAEPETAFALAAAWSDPRISPDLVIDPSWGGGAFRRDHLEGQVGWHAFGLPPHQTAVLIESIRATVVHPHLKNPVVRLRIPDEREHQQAVVAAVRTALTNDTDASQALAQAAERWRTLDRRQGEKVSLMNYRLSLSLNR
jgi:ABC-type glycerol-3-phosphate transport system substrate-binding protein